MESINALIEPAVFYAIAALVILSALGVVISRNIIHSALLLVVSFVGIAMCFFELQAGFLGLMQILIYGGAVSVLLIFAVMLVMQERTDATNPPLTRTAPLVISVVIGLSLLGGLMAAILSSHLPPAGMLEPIPDAVAALAGLMLGDYVLAFELAAILLLVAVAGAIVLARGEEERSC